MKVSLFVPCFVDQLYPDVAISMVNVLERLGCQVVVPEGQTCCGQPPFNSGYWDETRPVAQHMMDVFAQSDFIVAASGSCGSMMKVFYPQLFEKRPEEATARLHAGKVFEFSEFLVKQLDATDVGARFPAKATFHDGCHGLRELGLKQEPRQLLQHVRELDLVEMKEAETCCGFGGTFAVKFPMISTAMGEVKCASIVETEAEVVISNDSSCLMQIQGLLNRQGNKIRCVHLAQVLASR